MMLASIGATKIRRAMMPLFVWHAQSSLRAAGAAQGCVFNDVRFHDTLAFSLTVWARPQDMRAFATGRAHDRAVRWSWLTAKPSKFCHFQVTQPPTWAEAIARWEDMMATR